MSRSTSKGTPSLASDDDAERLMRLLCSASQEIGLSEGVCSPEKLPQYVNWMRKECQARRVWMLCEDGALLGMLILDENEDRILYVVVANDARRRGLGSILIRHVQSRASLCAEARNEPSRRMLQRCGFQDTGKVSPSGHPILSWRRCM
jgi:ribosomal protein S18 acetylase RimI-like enzyme